MDNGVKNSGRSNIKLAPKNIKMKDVNKVRELVAASTDVVEKIEPDIKVVEKAIRKTLMLDGLG